ncbi:CIC11C00000001155 [Sungouiella intermedia]|uniref:Mediator of RNA polymerase II transcription subunit 11 n=1 Tax=Sungouiella intermedia TaxID=45354 RepID=A0A1L0DGB4_9ASCO|nr:CIC11C00000003691 [[Candida] intermedia]SGZ55556.1 CIC11C00000001155 [[Candida] intermedia]
MDTKDFIQQRLESLNNIDSKVVKLLDCISVLFDTYVEPSRQNDAENILVKDQFKREVNEVYGLLSTLAIELRKEVKIVDDNIGVYDKNEDSVMILPINVDHKNTVLGKVKLEEELMKLTTNY